MKKTTILVTATCAFVLFAFGSAGMAHGWNNQGNQGGKLFIDLLKESDANRDDSVSSDEMMTRLQFRFAGADTDNSGTLTKVEILIAVEKAAKSRGAKRSSGRFMDRLVQRFDLDEDGLVSLDELKNRFGKLFSLADRNDDGLVMRRELAKLRAARMRSGNRGRNRWRHRSGWNDRP